MHKMVNGYSSSPIFMLWLSLCCNRFFFSFLDSIFFFFFKLHIISVNIMFVFFFFFLLSCFWISLHGSLTGCVLLMIESWVMCFKLKSNFAYCEIWMLFFVLFCYNNNYPKKGFEVVSVCVHVSNYLSFSFHGIRFLETVDPFVR